MQYLNESNYQPVSLKASYPSLDPITIRYEFWLRVKANLNQHWDYKSFAHWLYPNLKNTVSNMDTVTKRG